MNIQEIYRKYHTMPQLMEHQLKAAGVASLICDNFEGEINRTDIVAACLLHDLGNIVKFNLDLSGHHLISIRELERLDLWKDLQKKYQDKYGHNDHEATLKILDEIGASQRIKELVDCIGFHLGPGNAAAGDYGKKICAYSDMRVKPQGVASLEERFMDLQKRYVHHQNKTRERDDFVSSLREIEKQIFAQCRIKPEDITEEAVKPLIEGLKMWEI